MPIEAPRRKKIWLGAYLKYTDNTLFFCIQCKILKNGRPKNKWLNFFERDFFLFCTYISETDSLAYSELRGWRYWITLEGLSMYMYNWIIYVYWIQQTVIVSD